MLPNIGHSTLAAFVLDVVLGGTSVVCGVLLVRNASRMCELRSLGGSLDLNLPTDRSS